MLCDRVLSARRRLVIICHQLTPFGCRNFWKSFQGPGQFLCNHYNNRWWMLHGHNFEGWGHNASLIRWEDWPELFQQVGPHYYQHSLQQWAFSLEQTLPICGFLHHQTLPSFSSFDPLFLAELAMLALKGDNYTSKWSSTLEMSSSRIRRTEGPWQEKQ